MERRFTSLFNLSEAQAIALLEHPIVSSDGPSRYTAAAHLSTCDSDASISALLRALSLVDGSLENRIVRRKAIESLGHLRAKSALRAIYGCLSDNDHYTVENAVWAIGEIGTDDISIHRAITRLLSAPEQNPRPILQTLGKLGVIASLAEIVPFTSASDPLVSSAALAALSRLSGDNTQMASVVALLEHPNVLVRRLCIQDLIDADYTGAIGSIARCPVSLVFRLRGIRQLSATGISAGTLTFAQIQPDLEQVLRDHPCDLAAIHPVAPSSDLPQLMRALYDTDFSQCYRASQTLLAAHPTAPVAAALLATYAAEAHNDYGAHYHVIKLLGWLRHAPSFDLLLAALENRAPQFQKSRTAAAIALGELGDPAAIPALKASLTTQIWDLKYATLMTLAHLGDPSGYDQVTPDDDWLVQAQAQAHQSPSPALS